MSVKYPHVRVNPNHDKLTLEELYHEAENAARLSVPGSRAERYWKNRAQEYADRLANKTVQPLKNVL